MFSQITVDIQGQSNQSRLLALLSLFIALFCQCKLLLYYYRFYFLFKAINLYLNLQFSNEIVILLLQILFCIYSHCSTFVGIILVVQRLCVYFELSYSSNTEKCYSLMVHAFVCINPLFVDLHEHCIRTHPLLYLCHSPST
jgi:hypothetical protein